jgi:hypothetical protein
MRRQRGSILLYGLLALAVVTICGGALYAYNSAIKENAVLAGNLATSQQALQDQLTENFLQKQRQQQTDLLLANRQGERNASEKLERMIDDKLGKVYRDSAPARAWRDQPVPADVLRGVRNDTDSPNGKDKPRIPAEKSAGAAGSS